jgi:hypothetical protein
MRDNWRCAFLTLAGANFSIALLFGPATAERDDDATRPTVRAQAQATEERTEPAPESEEAASFVPPPRTIDDITAVLEGYKCADAQAVERDRALTNSAPPAGLEGSALIEFYEERGLAPGWIGRGRRVAPGGPRGRAVRQVAALSPTPAPGPAQDRR